MSQLSHKLIVKDPFEMPAVDDTTVLVLRECADLVPHCWIWNESVGYLEVVEYSGYDIYVTVKNVGMKENATSGTIFPSCMEFLITAPNATPIIDNTVTCLRADFKCPTVGQEALMSVDSTSAIRTGDLIIVDTRYQYLVTEIINEHTMKVLNEEKGKESGVINVNCNECVPVKIFESTHCCEALQEQVDDIYNRLDTKKSITPATDSLVRVSNGRQVLTDAFNDVVLDVNTDLSKYDNATSRFITLSDIPSLPDDIDLSHYDNTVSRFITSNDIPQIPTVNDATLTIYNSDGVTPFIEFSANAASNVTATLPQSGNTYTADSPLNITDNKITISQASATTDGYLSSTDWNTFNNKSGGLVYFEESLSGTNAFFQPKTSSSINTYYLGSSNNSYSATYSYDVYTNVLRNNYTNIDNISFTNSTDAGHYVTYNAGTNETNYGTHVFACGGGTKFAIFGNKNVSYSNLNPSIHSSNTTTGYNLGFSNEAWKESHIRNIYTNAINMGVGNGSTLNINAGTQVVFNTMTSTGTLNVIKNQAIIGNLGTSTNKWSNGYFSNIYSTDIYSNIEPAKVDTSSGSGHVGTNTRPYSNMVTNQLHARVIYSSNSAIQNWTWPSDSKLKTNIINRKNISSLTKLDKLHTYNFTYNKDVTTFGISRFNKNTDTMGFIADEVEVIAPECVETITDESTQEEYKAIKMYPLITMMLESIKELSAKVTELETKLGDKDAISKVLEK